MAVASDHAVTTKICSHCDRAIPSSNIDLHYAHCSRNLEKCKICDDMVPRKHAEEHYLSTHAPVTCSLCSETMDPEILALHKGEKCPKRIVTCDYCEFPLPAVDLFEHQVIPNNSSNIYGGVWFALGNHCGMGVIKDGKGTNMDLQTNPFGGYVGYPICASIPFLQARTLKSNPQAKCPLDLSMISSSNICIMVKFQEVCGNRTELCHLCSRYIRLRERVAHEVTCNGVPAEIPRSIRDAERERAARRPPPPPPQDISTRRLLFTIAITGIAILLGSLLFHRKPDVSHVN